MAVDAMDIDSQPVSTGPRELEKERKRKHKNKDEASSPSKKKRKHEKADDADKKSKKKDKSTKSKDKGKLSATTHSAQEAQSTSIPESPYSLTTATLYLPLSPISISPTHALASLLAEHLSPLLLTYYPPLQGIILAYSNASISSQPPAASSTSSPADLNPQPLTLAATAGEYGVMYVYLTATFLVFRPQRGQLLEGWVNVQSEGFLGAVVLNLFSVGIERKRLPQTWKWIPPGEEDETPGASSRAASSAPTSSDEDEGNDSSSPSFDPEKEQFNPIPLASDANPFSYDSLDQDTAQVTADGGEEEGDANGQNLHGAFDASDESVEGHFQSISGHRVRGTVKFRVVDIDIIPGSERDRGFLSIEGTMLSPEEEAKVLEDEKNGVIAPLSAMRKTTMIPISTMSGGIAPGEGNEAVDIELDSPSKKPVKAKGKKQR
ncbi:hypothetical protein BJX63DRAFT_407424 [Aspergillus granulosus]|uniref:DNA-directed RNA polymerase subunit n=1 Tax=Aspergillus granulosus TaxID=176169 RepID=A0ABR4H243_9EURO